MRPCLVHVAVAVAVGLAWGAPVATARPARTVVVRGVVDAAVDGSRFVAWPDIGTQGPHAAQLAAVTVLDDRTGRRQTFGLGRPCDKLFVPGGGAGRFVVNCEYGDYFRALILEAKSGVVRAVPDSPTRPTAYGDYYDHIGRSWLEGVEVSSKGGIFYRNWHTGEELDTSLLDGEPRPPFDLDSPRPRTIGPPRPEFAVGSGRALSQLPVGRSGGRRGIELRGAKTHRLLYRCGAQCHPISLKGGLALWSDYGHLFGYVLQTRRHRSWNMLTDTNTIGSTSTRIYYTGPRAPGGVLVDVKSFAWHR